MIAHTSPTGPGPDAATPSRPVTPGLTSALARRLAPARTLLFVVLTLID